MNSTSMLVLLICILATFDLVYVAKLKSARKTKSLSESLFWAQNLMILNNGTINLFAIRFHSAPVRHQVHSAFNYTYNLGNEMLDVSLETTATIQLFHLTLRNASVSTDGGFHRPGQIEIPLGNQDQYFNAFQQKNAKWPLKFVNSAPAPLNDLLYDQYPVRISEPLFYKSSGLAFLFDERNPLFVQQYNSPNHGYGIGYFYSNNSNPYMALDVESSYRNLRFHVIVSNENDVSKVVDYLAKNSTFIPKATSIPSEALFRHPTWLYTPVGENEDVNQNVSTFAELLQSHGYKNGTILRTHNFILDVDHWIVTSAKKTREAGFETKLIFTPTYFMDFVGELIPLVINKTDGKNTPNYDFSNPNTVDYFTKRYQEITSVANVSIHLKNYDDPFENYIATDPDCTKYPSMLLTKYVQTMSSIKLPVSISSEVAFKNQDIPMVVQLLHDDTVENFLESLIINSLAVSIAGYSSISPNPFNFTGTSEIENELFKRWIQAITFMPHITIYVDPWMHGDNGSIAHKFLQLHSEYTPVFIALAQERLTTGKPIIRPMWYQYPKQRQFFNVADQFMVGDNILVAPVIKLGQRVRTVIFPPGNWVDQHGRHFIVPSDSIQSIKVAAPLEELPYFISK